jgi:asparagine synthase (glutamine-hydrolysing)
MSSFQVVLSGEGSDEIFGGYPWFPLDYLRNADPAAASMGISLPTEAERHAMSEELPQMDQFYNKASSQNTSDGSRPLLDISAHFALAAVPPQHTAILRPEVLELVGKPNIARCLEEGIDVRVRQNSVSGNWHSLNVSLVCTMSTNPRASR